MNRKNRESGMITLETMFIFPITFFVVITLCYFTFYLCEYTRLQGLVENMAEEQAVCVKNNDSLLEKVDYQKRKGKGVAYVVSDLSDRESTLISKVKKKVKDEKILGDIKGVTAKISHTKVEIQLDMAISVGIPAVHEYFGGTPYKYQVTSSIPVHDPEEFARAYTALKDTLESTKGAKEIKKKLNEIKKVKKE